MHFKYFKIDSESTVDSLKKQFKENAKKFHPDFNNGSKEKAEQFKEMMQEYESALKFIGEQKGKVYQMDFEYTDLIISLLKMEMEEVDIEICGWFVYLWGNTKPHKDQLKSLGFFWNPKKICWYWKPPWYIKRNRESWDMSRIRETWGSEKIHQQEKEQQERERLTA